jgi:hypothetical protein
VPIFIGRGAPVFPGIFCVSSIRAPGLGKHWEAAVSPSIIDVTTMGQVRTTQRYIDENPDAQVRVVGLI